MGMQSVTYIIKPDGKIEIDVEGVQGSDCKEITKKVEERLGKVESVEFKASYYQGINKNQENIKKLQ